MGLGNRGFADLVSSGVGKGTGPTLPPRTGILDARTNRLSELASGQSILREQELVDPARCRIWEAHNRDYAALDEANCADLIESFRGQGRQEVAAIVRRVRSVAGIDFEVICGARRHWTTTWMRAHGYPDFKFLVEPRELSDEEAFRVADLENRSRRDLSDIERARDYLRALGRFYDGVQSRMAERLEVSNSWLSRYLELARLPEPVIAAFGAADVLKISHGGAIAPLLRNPVTRPSVLEIATTLASEQQALRRDGEAFLSPAIVLQRIQAAMRPMRAQVRAEDKHQHIVRAPNGVIVARGQRAARGGGLTIQLSSASAQSKIKLLAAVEEILNALVASGEDSTRLPKKGRVRRSKPE